MTLYNFAIWLSGLSMGYVIGTLFYKPPKHNNKYKVTEITSADIVRSIWRKDNESATRSKFNRMFR